MLQRLVQFILILLAAVLGYQLPSWNISLPIALLGVIGYGFLSYGLLRAVNRPHQP